MDIPVLNGPGSREFPSGSSSARRAIVKKTITTARTKADFIRSISLSLLLFVILTRNPGRCVTGRGADRRFLICQGKKNHIPYVTGKSGNDAGDMVLL
jgi:hypothetical protein